MKDKRQESDKVRWIKSLLLAFVCSLSLSLKLGNISVKHCPYKGAWLKNLYKFRMSFQSQQAFSAVVVLAAFTFMIYQCGKLEVGRRCRMFNGIFSAAAGILLVCCKGFLKEDSLALVFGSKFAFGKAVLVMCGYGLISYYVMNLLFEYVLPRAMKRTESQGEGSGRFLVTRKRCFLAIMIAWIPYFVSFYPCNFTPDAKDEVAQFIGDRDNCWSKNSEIYSKDAKTLINNHHPVAYTLLVGSFAKAGMELGNINLSMFLFVLLQAAALAMIYSSTVVFVNRMGSIRWVTMATLLFFMFFPLIPMYAITVTKDSLFGGMMLLVTMGLFELTAEQELVLASWKKKAKILASCVGLTLFRNNGIYILYFLIVILLILFRKNKKALRDILFMYGIPILFYSVIVLKVIFPYFDIPKGTAREMLSVPMQQISRYVSQHGTEGMTEADIEAIDQVIDTEGDIENLAAWYDPRLSDPVKRHYNIYATSEDLKAFIGVWGKLLLKRPAVFVEATFNNVFYLVSWEYDNQLFYNGIMEEGYWYGLHNPEGLYVARNTMAEGIKILASSSILGHTMSIGVWDWVLLAMILYVIYRRCYRCVLIGVPFLVNLLISIAGPTIYMRYAIEWIVLVPLFVCMTASIERKKEAASE